MPSSAPSQPRDPQRLLLIGSSSAAGGFLIRFGARLLLLFVAARLYGPTLFGAYALAVATVEFAVTIGGIGMKKQVFRFLDERGERAVGHVLLDAILAVTLCAGALAAAVMLAIALLPDWLIAENSARALLLLAPMIVGQALLDLSFAATRWHHRVRYEVIGRSIVEPYAGVAGAIAAWAVGWNETGLLIGYWAGTLAALAYAVPAIRGCFGPLGLGGYRLSATKLAATVRASSANTATDALNGLFGRVDLYLVGVMLGEAPAGIYNMVRQLAIPIRQVRQSFDGMLTPLVGKTLRARGTGETGAAIASAVRLILVLQLPLLIALVLIGAPLLGWLGPAFAAGHGALILLGAAECIQAAFGIGDLFFVYRRPGLGFRITAVSIAIGTVAGVALIGAWGLEGAGAAVLLTYAIRAALRRWALGSAFGVRMPPQHSLVPIGAALAGIALGLLAADLLAGAPSLDGIPALHWAVPLAAALAVYAALLTLALRMTGDSLALVRFSTD